MVDSQSINSVANVTSAFSFKSGDISGTAAKMSDEKNGQGSEYFQTDAQGQQVMQPNQYVDRSAQLRATLNSLAMMNVANLLASKRKKELVNEIIDQDEQIDEEEFKDVHSEYFQDITTDDDFDDDEELEQT